jgi:hypothetical protein
MEPNNNTPDREELVAASGWLKGMHPAMSIAAKGILQNLVVEPETNAESEPTGFYLVSIGEGRRLAQLLRAKRKEIKKTEPIRCVIDTANDPFEISLDENVTLIGVDYEHRTANVYFGEVDECLEPDTIRAMLRDMGMPQPSEQMLNFAQQSFGFYATLSWDSPKIERFCYSAITPDPVALLDRIEPKIEHFLKTIPYGVDDPKAVYVATSPADGEYYKIQSYYQWRSRLVNHMHTSVSDSGE